MRGRLFLTVAAALLVVAATAPVPATSHGPRPPKPTTAAASAARVQRQLPAHAASEGYVLGAAGAAAADSRASTSATCPASAPIRRYDVAAIDVDITLNRYLDHDPEGRMYVLERDLARVRAEEARNAAARKGRGDPAVSIGLQGDAIQPLTLRVAPGECLQIRFRNALAGNEPASLHLHAAALRVAGGGPAIATNKAAVVGPGRRVTYEWMVGAKEPETTHYFHSHGDERNQTSHGLFGAVIVEPRHSTWLDPTTGRPLETGWDAMIRPHHGPAFREFALYYHEIGNELFQPRDRNDQLVPLVDPITQSYRPDGRALNYRSEPFMDRLQLQKQLLGRVDESTEYSSYAFGDPATPTMRSYVGDPVKQRVIHAGSEVFHVHHVHGGSIRWRRQPATEDSRFATGLDKHPPLHPGVSERTDSQSIGPSETVDIADECGSGGCQQSVGDFMYHCHVTFHYFSGMWGIWRVYNTRQDGRSSTDTMPPLVDLPDRAGQTQAAVTARDLIGHTVDSYGTTAQITDANLAAWVAGQLPPPGVPRGYDASVWDWQPDAYLGEPEATQAWPAYRSAAPGQRPPLLFDPRTGKPAYPMLRPHLGERPPFAPNHGPAPYLDPAHTGTDPPPPGANGAGSDCPSGTRQRQVPINVINAPVPLNGKADLTDPFGELYVLRDQEDAVRANPNLRVPLVIRANAGQDCLDVLLRSELEDNAGDPFSKVSAHIHFVQFDVQGSDGVNTGFNYEQTVRPFRAAGTPLAATVAAGSTRVAVADAGRFQAGAVVGVGMDKDSEFETHRVVGVAGNTLALDGPLTHAHDGGEIVSTEFVRYRWYPDSQFGTAFFHDHVNVINSGRHGLFGSLIVEPPGSTWVDPHTGAPLESGPIADVHNTEPISTDVKGSFRELAALLQDDNPLTAVTPSNGSSVDLRVEPLDERSRDPSMIFSSAGGQGDPATPLIEAYLGDPVAIRSLVGSNNEVHSLHVDGHWFRVEPWDNRSPPTDTVNVGISERFDVAIPGAGGPQRMPGDYLYYDGRAFKMREGTWGLLRVYDAAHTGLEKLPGHEVVPSPAASVCPSDAPRRAFAVDAIQTPLAMLDGGPGKVYVLDSERAAMASGRQKPEPLALHADVGDCVVVTLRNATTDGPVSFHADMLAADPRRSGGVAAGNDPPQAVAPGATGTFTYYASPEVGETTALVRDFGDVLHNPELGLYGAVVVGPRGARYRDPVTGADIGNRSSWQAVVVPPDGHPYRDFSLFFQDEDAHIGTHRMPYTTKVDGAASINYTSAAGGSPAADPNPPTPLLRAFAGDPVRVHVLSPWSEQAQVFSIEGHRWPVEPGRKGTPLVSSTQLSATNALTLSLEGGAGGPAHVTGDYLYGNHRIPYQDAGQWGLFRVLPRCQGGASLRRLAGSDCGGVSVGRVAATGVGIAAVIAVGVAAAAVVGRRRRRHVTANRP